MILIQLTRAQRRKLKELHPGLNAMYFSRALRFLTNSPLACLVRNGAIGYDYFIGQYITPDTPTAEQAVRALAGQTLQVVAYFNVKSWKPANGEGERYFQDCYIAEMYQVFNQ